MIIEEGTTVLKHANEKEKNPEKENAEHLLNFLIAHLRIFLEQHECGIWKKNNVWQKKRFFS